MTNAASLQLQPQFETQAGWAPDFPSLLHVPRVEKTFWRGMAIYNQEEAATHLYLVLRGRVKILRTSAEGQHKVVSLRYRGDIFGELALAGEPRHSDDAIALDTTRVGLIRLNDFWQALKQEPAAWQGALQHLAARLAEAQRQIEALVFDNIHKRLAQALLALSAAAARVGETSVRLTHEELAELIGSSREVVTGMMIEFRQRGLIDYKRGEVWPKLSQLEKFLAAGGVLTWPR
jgi:CRP/FNR family transcriptional regulator